MGCLQLVGYENFYEEPSSSRGNFVVLDFSGCESMEDESEQDSFIEESYLEPQNGRQLRTVTGTDFGTLTFEYDLNGLRTRKHRTSDNQTAYYFWQGNHLVAAQYGHQFVWFHYDDAGVSGMNVNGVDYVFRRNALGDITELYQWGALIGRYTYDAWGNHRVWCRWAGYISPDANHTLNLNPFRWRGKYFDVESGLYYMQSRFYDPQTGRFINADCPTILSWEAFASPVHGANLYIYAMNNPVMFVDPTGYSATLFTLAFIISAVIIGTTAVVGGVVGGVMAHQNGESILAGIGMGLVSGLAIGSGAVLGFFGHPHLGSMLVGGGLESLFNAQRNMQNGGSMFGGWAGGFISGTIKEVCMSRKFFTHKLAYSSIYATTLFSAMAGIYALIFAVDALFWMLVLLSVLWLLMLISVATLRGYKNALSRVKIDQDGLVQTYMGKDINAISWNESSITKRYLFLGGFHIILVTLDAEIVVEPSRRMLNWIVKVAPKDVIEQLKAIKILRK